MKYHVHVKEEKLNLHVLKCPNCDATIDIDNGIDTFFCKYCGYKIILEGQSDAAYQAKTKIKSFQHKERMAEKNFEFKKYKIEQKAAHETKKTKTAIIIAISCIALYILLVGLIIIPPKVQSNKQETALQELVTEIQNDIDEGNFDDAYIKAQSIKYTANWSSDIEEKWDNIRKEVINQIIEEEKEVTGKSSHKPEKDGFLSNLFN